MKIFNEAGNFDQLQNDLNKLVILLYECSAETFEVYCSIFVIEERAWSRYKINIGSPPSSFFSTSVIDYNMADERKVNRLILEKSPYLLQHAYNPVDWLVESYPWCKEAFDKAAREQKLIFLSIGYSTCHWCHVMEHESFESEEIGEILNQNFVSIKVDREERPDVDKMYMNFVQATNGSDGWPMSVWLTPDLKPLVGGTYFPPKNQFGRPGFGTVLQKISCQNQ
uniref:DUF255 domain-containing protein n=1 Tax=Romanomermis culicivorax TaxID=13658 RepID=A0A915KH11_ROMCU